MSDYDRIAEAIVFITEHVVSQPTLDEIAAHLHLSPFHFQRMFSRWVGVTPKRYLQTLTVERAKQLLAEPRPLLEVSDTLGLSSGSRLYDHFIHLEAVTPGEYKQRGKDLTMDYAVHQTPFGKIFIAMTPRGICKLSFLDYSNINDHLVELRNNWPLAAILENRQSTLPVVEAMFKHNKTPDRPLSLYVSGTNFQISVWKALLQIPPGAVVSYTQIAEALGKPRSARAVGTAIGANPVAFLIPCHRVIQKSGKLGGYHWGETRMHAIHAWETARQDE
jgi:AraC family transcriptional regulator of adaptative response/methylated-DNA-[protein]-cysteine methyltransferase